MRKELKPPDTGTENSDLYNIIHNPNSWILFLLVIVILSITVIPFIFVNGVMTLYNYNSTKVEMHATIAGNFLIFFITVAYVIITYFLVIQNQEAIEQSKNEQRLRDIEKRLENFYIPLKDKLDFLAHDDEWTRKFTNQSNLNNHLQDINKYSYLADEEAYKKYEKYITSRCSELKSTTCDDQFKANNKDILIYHNCDFYNSSYKEGFPCWIFFNSCEHNYNILCDKYDSCKKKENTICKYNTDLKKQVIEDIESYKKKIRELKNESKRKVL